MNVIQNKREQLGVTQVEFARLIGVSQSAVAKWETGEAMPRADKLPELAKILGCTIDELYQTTSWRGGICYE